MFVGHEKFNMKSLEPRRHRVVDDKAGRFLAASEAAEVRFVVSAGRQVCAAASARITSTPARSHRNKCAMVMTTTAEAIVRLTEAAQTPIGHMAQTRAAYLTSTLLAHATSTAARRFGVPTRRNVTTLEDHGNIVARILLEEPPLSHLRRVLADMRPP
jgi:hypothetical protein